MTHFVGLVNIGVSPSGFTEEHLAAWIENRLLDVISPYDENLQVASYIEKSNAELLKEKERLIELQSDPTSYMYKKYKDKDIKNMPLNKLVEWYYKQKLDDSGNLLTEYNPRSRWDWWVIGGRWKGLLLNKASERVDMSMIEEIDFDSMRRNVEKVAYEMYSEYIELISMLNKNIDNERTKELKNQFYFDDKPKTENTPDGQKIVVERVEDYYNRVYGGGYFGSPTYADIYGWHSRTSYGWFGMSTGDKGIDKLNYNKQFEEFIKSLDGKTILIVVDFHT